MSHSSDDKRPLPAHWRFDRLIADGAELEPDDRPADPADRPLWLSLEEKLGEGAPGTGGGEFPAGASEPPQGVARRELLGLAGAALALAGAGCYTRPAEKILPYTTQPDLLFPGTPLHYATALSLGGAATGLLVTSWEGRPTKVEGNPDHPASQGATGIFEQAWVLQLYDPDRARQVKSPKGPVAWRSFLEHLAQKLPHLAQTRGAGLRFLVEPTSSPLIASLRQQILARYPEARFVAYDAIARDEAFEGARLAFGRPLDVLPDLSRADVVVALDSDFLQPLPGAVRHALQFGERRDPEAGPMNRLYVAESGFTVTGSVADHRARVRSVDVAHVALGLLARVGGPLADAARRLARPLGMDRWLDAVAADLVKSRGRSLVLVGDRQPALVHAIGHALNSALGNLGATAQLVSPAVLDTRAGPASLGELAEEIRRGQVDTLVVTAKNPAYASPASVGFADLLSKVPEVVYLGLYEDETAQRSGWFLPEAHGLESWGDGRARDGTAAIRQPLIQPLFSGIADSELLSAFLGGPDRSAYDLLREHWRAHAAGQGFEAAWKGWLARGVIPGTASAPVQVRFDTAAVLAQLSPGNLPPADGGLEINFRPDYKVHDGRFANHPWLQELPDPITKVTWENAVLMGPATARKLDVGSGDVVELRHHERAVQGPVFIVPGHADDSVTVALGYGRAGAESVARGVGFDAYRLQSSVSPWFDVGLEIRKTRGTHRFANTQAHWSMEGRPVALDQMLADYRTAPDAATKTLKGPVATLQAPVQYPGFRWAMSVDLSRCTGCSACVVACQAENNVPTVGKEQVANGREMHWLRIDRYFVGQDIADPQLVTQPMLCQHCETAPCEYVCPVNATVHSDEGLNEMIYNRCVGTRYCGNNCPYKVRRFNFLHWTARLSPTEQMAMNPDVTVRDRGVMEKCTFCVQRIERTRIDARIHNGGKIPDGAIQTACQQACPTRAIVFGTLSDEGAQVTERHARARRYDVLHDLGTRPRVAYLLRIRNPNPELA